MGAAKVLSFTVAVAVEATEAMNMVKKMAVSSESAEADEAGAMDKAGH
jgi:hypothetical protein